MIAERGVPGFAIAEPARHGFEGLEADPPSAANAAGANPVAALEGCAQAHLSFAWREASVHAAMFDPQLPMGQHPELSAAHDAAFLVLRRAVEATCISSHAPRRPRRRTWRPCMCGR